MVLSFQRFLKISFFFFFEGFLDRLDSLSNFKLFLTFCNVTAIINPRQNSSPARANKRKVVDIKVKSSFIMPVIAEYEYKTIQLISENNITFVMLFIFTSNIEVEIQKVTPTKLKVGSKYSYKIIFIKN